MCVCLCVWSGTVTVSICLGVGLHIHCVDATNDLNLKHGRGVDWTALRRCVLLFINTTLEAGGDRGSDVRLANVGGAGVPVRITVTAASKNTPPTTLTTRFADDVFPEEQCIMPLLQTEKCE